MLDLFRESCVGSLLAPGMHKHWILTLVGSIRCFVLGAVWPGNLYGRTSSHCCQLFFVRFEECLECDHFLNLVVCDANLH